MILSDEQMAAVTGGAVSEWTEVNRPVGPQALPAWVRGAHVKWWNGAMNAPTVTLKVVGNVLNWDDKRWSKEGHKTYIARSGDGRAVVLYHDGPITKQTAWRLFGDDAPVTYKWSVPERKNGETWEAAAHREGAEHLEKVWHFNEKYPSGKPDQGYRVIVKSLDVTTKQSGFGGDGYLLAMTDGTERMLRGPWHGGAPDAYVEVSAVDASKTADKWESTRAWHRRGGYGGLYLTEELFLRIIARYCPHVPIMRVEHSYGSRLEPYRAEWDAPKADIYELERGRAERKEPAGEFWRVYWDGRECYCGSMRIPRYGFQPGVMDLPTPADHALAARKPW